MTWYFMLNYIRGLWFSLISHLKPGVLFVEPNWEEKPRHRNTPKQPLIQIFLKFEDLEKIKVNFVDYVNEF